MGDINYEPIIRDMKWSYSRIKSFEDCPYRWYLRYIRRQKGKEMFFASYGTFVHKLLEMYFKGENTPKQLYYMYLQDFHNEVKGEAPSSKIYINYFQDGLRYFKNLQPIPYNVIAVEKKVSFLLEGIPFLGYIDILAEKNGELYVIDNKSRKLQPRSRRSRPTRSDALLDGYLEQLYLYSEAIKQEFGKYPKGLCFNCFRVPNLIEEPFDEKACETSLEKTVSKIDEIAQETDFRPNMDFFKCRHLCEMNEYCEYYQMNSA